MDLLSKECLYIEGDSPSFLDFVDIQGLPIFVHNLTERGKQFNDLLQIHGVSVIGYVGSRITHTLTTSTGSFFMLLGHVSSGLFSGSPGLKRIFNLFFTSSMTSLAALESSSKSFRTISWGTLCDNAKEDSRRLDA